MPTVTSQLIPCPVAQVILLSLSVRPSVYPSGPGGGEHFKALWRLPEAAQPEGLPERWRRLNEVRIH